MGNTEEPRFFSPEGDLADAGNAGYLACLLDRGHVGVRRSKRNGHPLGVRIGLGESHPNAERAWQFIREHWAVEGTVRTSDKSKAPSIQKRKLIGETPNLRVTYYLSITRPEDVLKLCETALRYSERKEKLQKAIEACRYLLARRGKA